MSLNDAVHYPVQTQYITMGYLSLSFGRKLVGPQIRDGPVDIPLHIINICAVKYLVYAFNQIILDFFTSHIKDQLVTASYCSSS